MRNPFKWRFLGAVFLSLLALSQEARAGALDLFPSKADPSIRRGESFSGSITVGTATGALTKPVSYSFTVPSGVKGVTATFSPNNTTSRTVNFTISASATATLGWKDGYYVKATQGTTTNRFKMDIDILPVATTTMSLNPSTATYTSMVGTAPSAQSFTLSNTGGAPATLTKLVLAGTNASLFSFQNNNCNGKIVAAGASCTFGVSAAAPTAALNYIANVTVQSPNVPTSPVLTLSLLGADYRISSSSTNFNITQGHSDTSTINISRTNMNGVVSLALGNAPEGVSATFTPNNTTESISTMLLAVSNTVPANTYQMTVNSVSGTRSSSIPLTLTVAEAPPPPPPDPTPTDTTGSYFQFYLQRDFDQSASWTTPIEMDWYSNSAPVYFSAVNLDPASGLSVTVTPSPVTKNSINPTVNFNLASSGVDGYYTFILRANAGGVVIDQPMEVTLHHTTNTSPAPVSSSTGDTSGSTPTVEISSTSTPLSSPVVFSDPIIAPLSSGTTSSGTTTSTTTSSSSSSTQIAVSSTATNLTAINQDRYDIGNPTLTTIYMSPSGSDTNNGLDIGKPIKSLNSLGGRIRSLEGITGVDQVFTLSRTGYQIILLPGTYPDEQRSHIMDNIHGTDQYPIIIKSSTGNRSDVVVKTDLEFDGNSHVYLMDFTISRGGDVLHFGHSDHMLVRNMILNGVGGAHDMFKVNQSQYVYLEDSDLQGADDNTVDWVSVQTGRMIGNKIHNSQDWCAYVKGGSAYIVIENNEIFGCGTGGFTTGQGTGFEYMVAPWLNYETYDVKVVNNIIHDVQGAGLGAQGSFNTLFAYNTLYKVGDSTYHWGRTQAFEILHGGRECDHDTDPLLKGHCDANLSSGGWGQAYSSSSVVPIPTKNIYIFNNIIYNPDGYNTVNTVFNVENPATSYPASSNIPSPSKADENVIIKGNLIYVHAWPGEVFSIFSQANGCSSSNPTCNERQVIADNTINTLVPQLSSPAAGNFRPVASSNVFSVPTYTIPDFDWNNVPTLTYPAPVSYQAVPTGTLSNNVPVDRTGASRNGASTVGAYVQ